MLDRLKKSPAGRVLKRISKRRFLGWPVRLAVRVTHWDILAAGHLKPAHLAHNARQARLLAEYRRETRQGRA